MRHLFININNDLNNTLNVKKYLNKKNNKFIIIKKSQKGICIEA